MADALVGSFCCFTTVPITMVIRVQNGGIFPVKGQSFGWQRFIVHGQTQMVPKYMVSLVEVLWLLSCGQSHVNVAM